MISIIISSRCQGNPNHDLYGLMCSLKIQTSGYKNIEVLVKYDEDDSGFEKVISDINKTCFPFYIRFVKGQRGKGYIYIHKGYNQLLPYINDRCTIVVAMADDFTVETNWDKELLSQAEGDYFIIHQRPHPKEGVARLSDGVKYPNFYLGDDVFGKGDNLYVVDEAPAWSKKLLDDVVSFPISFTDMWTLCLEKILWEHYNINITKFTGSLIINRRTCDIDEPSNNRWSTDRKENFEYIKSSEFKAIIMQQALAVYANQEALV